MSTTLARRKLIQAQRWRGALVSTVLLVSIIGGGLYLAQAAGDGDYQPLSGDVLFQSSPRSQLTSTIEGATRSPYSHCGLLVQEEGRWVVYEALEPVRRTPLERWIAQGRQRAFAAYRLKEPEQTHISGMIEYVRKQIGKPYDMRYRMDDEKLYCSELVFKAYRSVTGKPLGKLVRLDELDWKPYRRFIESLEQGPVPLDRELITPRDLAEAEQLERVYSAGYALESK